jgi:hypothetical protein
MRRRIMWIVLSFKASVISILTFVRTPEEISQMLITAASENKWLAVAVRAVYAAMAATGFAVKRIRNAVFGTLLVVLAGSALAVSIRYAIPPNIMIFAVFAVLTVRAMTAGELRFEITEQALMGKVFGFAAIILGFYYPHWVDEPVFLNALAFSPLGIANCPTISAFCGFLCFLKRPGSPMLEAFVGAMTLYFGFFGVMRLGAAIDLVMIVSGAFLLLRLAAGLDESILVRRGIRRQGLKKDGLRVSLKP